jgi:predicted acyl esterase
VHRRRDVDDPARQSARRGGRLTRELPNVVARADDGCELAMRIWLPDGPEPVPAILEATPYRKDDFTRARDRERHPWFAEHGYAAVRLDLRGSGASGGLLVDEYTDREQRDVVNVIDWLCEQPWCDGHVAMIGLSWGGFLALAVAARRPPALKAIVAVCSSGDRYGGDVKYMGGCLLATQLVPWASTVLAETARPPDPEVVGPGWRTQWLERLEHARSFAESWLAHQRRDGYWAEGSADYSRIRCPILAVGGWADPYRDTVFDLLEQANADVRGLIGPWGHDYPDSSTPGPAIDFRRECAAFLDAAFAGAPPPQPPLRAWIDHGLAPGEQPVERTGRWAVGASTGETRLFPTEDGLLVSEPAAGERTVVSPLRTGADAGAWLPWGPGDFAPDQRRDDGLSLTFTSRPLAVPVVLLGRPRVRLTVHADAPRALLAARLTDVAPDGTSTLLTRGLVNLCHRDGSEHPQPLVPGEPVTAEIRLGAVGYELETGHSVRLGISPAYWSWAWPSPTVVTLHAELAGCYVTLPVCESLGPADPPPDEHSVEPGEPVERRLQHDVATRRQTVEVKRTRDRQQPAPDGPEFEVEELDRFSIVEGDPLSAEVVCTRTIKLERSRRATSPEWRTRVGVHSRLSCDAADFVLETTLEAFEADERVFRSDRRTTFPRDHV